MQLLETMRLQGRQFSLNDLADLTVILSDPEVMKYSLNGVYDEAATREFIEWCMECYDTHGFGPLAQIDADPPPQCPFQPEVIVTINAVIDT